MPYRYLSTSSDLTRLHLWPHRSLRPGGFATFIGLTAALIAMPALALLGTPALWVLLPFLIAAVAAIWAALQRSNRDREIIEDLTLTRDLVTLTRHGPRGRRQDFQSNPYWLRLTLHPQGGPVPNYLTLKGEHREVELGAFLSEEERIALRDDLAARLAALR